MNTSVQPKKLIIATNKVYRLSITGKKALLFPYSILLLGLSISVGGVLTSIICFLIYVLSVIIVLNKGNLSDPRMLFLGFLFVYSTWYPLRVIVTSYSVLDINLNLLKQTINYSFFGAVVFITVANIIINEKKVKKHINIFNRISERVYYLNSEKIILNILILISIIVFYNVLTSGSTSKSEAAGFMSFIGNFTIIFLSVLFTLRLLRLDKPFFIDGFVICYLLFMTIYVLVLGERDAIFRLLFICTVIYFDKNRKGNYAVIIGIMILVSILVPISQSFKSVLLSGEFNLPNFGVNLILSNEFISASRNLYSLLLFEVQHNIQFIFTDIIRAFSPTFLLTDFNISSTNVWFNSVFRVQHGFDGSSGWGFGIIAQGYLVGGMYGILFIMSIYSAIICYFYNLRFKSIYTYVFYIMMLITAIYCIRADLANFLSQSFKVSGIMIILVIASHEILKKR